MATLPCQKDHFSLPEDLHYLNCAYMGPLPRAAEEAGVRALRMKRDPTSIEPRHFFEESDRLRRGFAHLVGSDEARRVAIHPAVSYAVATAARNLPLSRGAGIVLAEAQFPANVYAWRRMAQEAGGAVHTVPRPEPDATGSVGAEWNERLLEAITPATEVVALPTVHWTDGTRFDLEAIGARAREVGAALVVDASQSLGAMPFRVGAVRPDLVVAAAYKWLLGPYSLALTWMGERFDHGVPLEETWIGRGGSEDFQGLVQYTDEYQPGALRYDVGERSNFALLPVARAALDLVLEWTPEAVSAYVAALSAPLLEEASALGFGVESPAWRSPHLFGLRMPDGVSLKAVREALARRRVAVSLRGDALRVSPQVYNEPRDVDALLRALREAVA
ncbi:MAG: aminotransferase class V-fold PLP-dependent enzyme [Longimicrobiales bacterium]|nr:aminotransferase class V-fold PLP-dependent enzyme [Longimicrobiales bacterium]